MYADNRHYKHLKAQCSAFSRKNRGDQQSRAADTILMRLIDNPIYRAEGQMLVIDLRTGVPFLWPITNLSHQLTSGGFTLQIDDELPKAK